jgi:hypothetical protein
MSDTTANDPSTSKPMTDEADIGSGEKTPGQKETEEMIRQIPPLPADGQEAPPDQPGITSPS